MKRMAYPARLLQMARSLTGLGAWRAWCNSTSQLYLNRQRRKRVGQSPRLNTGSSLSTDFLFQNLCKLSKEAWQGNFT